MTKDPAMLWYPSDWVSGTQGMSFEEKGAYMDLLMMQFNRGHMTEHMIGQVAGQLWGQIKHKFTLDEDGLWYNKRVDYEKEKRKSFTSSRRNNLSGKNQYSKSGHTTSRMVNVNENISINTLTISNTSWETEKTLFRNSEQWQMKQCTEFKLSKKQVLDSVEEFLKELDNKEDYKDVKELKRHWYGWYKFNQNKKPSKPELSQYQKDLLAKREEYKNKTAQ